MKRAEPSSEPPAVFVVRNVLFSRASSRFDDRSKYTLTGTISSKPAQLSSVEHEAAKSDHQKMVASIRERNQRLQKMNTELENELRALVEDRVLLDVQIEKIKKTKPATAPTTIV
jgi:hypothetical protein